MTVPLRRPTAGTTVDAIKQYVRDHGLLPGDVMPTEAELCAALGVSRSSVREAMRTLASLDIVDVQHGRGTYVGRMSLDPLVNGMVFRLSLDAGHTLKSMRDVIQTRRALDLSVGEELVALHSGTHDPELHRLVETMADAHRSGSPFLEEDSAFHARLLEQVDNRVMAELAGAFWEIHTRALPLLGITPPDDRARTVEAHRAMLAALEAGDLAAYEEAVDAHYAPLRRALERAIAERGAPNDTAGPTLQPLP